MSRSPRCSVWSRRAGRTADRQADGVTAVLTQPTVWLARSPSLAAEPGGPRPGYAVSTGWRVSARFLGGANPEWTACQRPSRDGTGQQEVSRLVPVPPAGGPFRAENASAAPPAPPAPIFGLGTECGTRWHGTRCRVRGHTEVLVPSPGGQGCSYEVTPPGRSRVGGAPPSRPILPRTTDFASVSGGLHPSSGAAYILILTVSGIARTAQRRARAGGAARRHPADLRRAIVPGPAGSPSSVTCRDRLARNRIK